MADFDIDVDAIEQEIGSMTPDEIKEKLLKLRTREKVTQKKAYNSENAKKYAAKARERQKLMKAKAQEMGIWDEINEQAEAAANAKLAEDTDTEPVDTDLD